jgi:VWFA-related protein
MSGVCLRRRFALLAALLACASYCLRVCAQTNSSPQPAAPQGKDSNRPVLKTSVRRVVIDVVVSDSGGKPVPNLSANEFAITEDGKPQRILSFDVHDFDSVSENLPKLPPLPPNTFVNLPSGPERGPLYVLLLDLLNMSVDNQPIARRQLLKFVRNKPLGTRFAIFVLSDGLHLVQGFTEDRNLLAEALDPQNHRSRIPRIFLYADNYQAYLPVPLALINIAKFLVDLPGHKNIIWCSESFPSAILPSADPNVEGISYSDKIKEATDALARGQVAVYPVDVRGVVARTPSLSVSPIVADEALNATYLTEEEIAHVTGGRAFHGSNDLSAELDEATETGGHYYTLSYSPTNSTYNGNLRHIRVELAKRGYNLAYRRSYYGNPDTESTGKKQSPSDRTARNQPANALYVNMAHGAPISHQLLFRAHIRAVGAPVKATPEQMAILAGQRAYFGIPDKSQPGKTPKPIPLQAYEIDYSIAARKPNLEVAAVSFDGDGKLLNGMVQTVDNESLAIRAEEQHEGIFRIRQTIDIPVAAVSMRVVVRDDATNNVGALEINLPLVPEQAPSAAAHPGAPGAGTPEPQP